MRQRASGGTAPASAAEAAHARLTHPAKDLAAHVFGHRSLCELRNAHTQVRSSLGSAGRRTPRRHTGNRGTAARARLTTVKFRPPVAASRWWEEGPLGPSLSSIGTCQVGSGAGRESPASAQNRWQPKRAQVARRAPRRIVVWEAPEAGMRIVNPSLSRGEAHRD